MQTGQYRYIANAVIGKVQVLKALQVFYSRQISNPVIAQVELPQLDKRTQRADIRKSVLTQIEHLQGFYCLQRRDILQLVVPKRQHFQPLQQADPGYIADHIMIEIQMSEAHMREHVRYYADAVIIKVKALQLLQTSEWSDIRNRIVRKIKFPDIDQLLDTGETGYPVTVRVDTTQSNHVPCFRPALFPGFTDNTGLQPGIFKRQVIDGRIDNISIHAAAKQHALQ